MTIPLPLPGDGPDALPGAHLVYRPVWVPPIEADTADRLGDPGRVPAEEGVVGGGAQEADDAQLHDEVVDQLLDLRLGVKPRLQVALTVDVEEGGDPAEAHRRPVLLLRGGEEGEVEPLDRLLGVSCRL